MNRREMITRSGALALGLGLGFQNGRPALAADVKKKVLFFSKSSGFEHSAIKRKDGQPSFAETVLANIGPKNGLDFTFSKDGSLFTPEYLAQFDAFFFYTTGDLTTEGTDKNPPMTKEGKQAFLDAISKGGKGFIGSHSASDTFHTGESGGGNPTERSARYKNYGDAADPYIKMLGGEFIKHGPQQLAKMRVADPNFPGLKGVGAEFDLQEEWYSLKDFAPNLHVLLVQETAGMKGDEYKRAAYPATWMRLFGDGRVFFTSMGHREDVWTNPLFQNLLLSGIGWTVKNFDADVTPNLAQAAPGYAELPPVPAAEPPKTEKKEKKKTAA